MKKGIYCTLLALTLTAAVFLLPILNSGYAPEADNGSEAGRSSYNIVDKKDNQTSSPEVTTPKSDETVTFIITVEGNSFLDTVFSSGGKYHNAAELIGSEDFRQYSDQLKKSQAVVKASIRRIVPEAGFDNCFTYNTVLNGFSVTAPYSSRSKLEKISGVLSVTLSSSQSAVITETGDSADENKGTSLSAGSMTGIQKTYSEELTGKGSVIAVIDNGFNCSDEMFTVSPSGSSYTKEKLSSMISSAGFNINSGADTYKSGKIIYAYDYAERDDDTYVSASGHGTKTAAAAAGCSSLENGYKGAAYNSSLILMKVFADNENSASDDVLLAALDDAAKLSPDVINLSLGVPRTNSTAELFEGVYSRLSQSGIYIAASAGNDSENLRDISEKGIGAAYTDYSTISFPSSLACVTSVGAVDSNQRSSCYFTDDDGKELEYQEILSEDPDAPQFLALGRCEYVYLSAAGESRDYNDMDVSGKIVVVKGGVLDFSEKIINAADADAAGIIIFTDDELYYSFQTEDKLIPAAVVSSELEEYFESYPAGTLTPSDEPKLFAVKSAGKPSVFTSYGVTSDLRLKPDIMAPGTDIETGSGKISGTSASSAIISGTAAVLGEYADMRYSGVVEKNTLIKALMMNTADPIRYDDDRYYTPRLQGAGVLNVENVLSAKAVIMADGAASASIGDSEEGSYRFAMTLTSLSEKDESYQLSYLLQTDKYSGKGNEIYNLLIPENISEQAEVGFYSDDKEIKEIVVPAGESVSFEMRIRLLPEMVLACKVLAPNGFYVDGFVFLSAQEGASLHLPLMGYCGSWSGAEIFDSTEYETDSKPVIGNGTLTATAALGSTYPDFRLGMNMTTGLYDAEHISVGKDTVKNYLDISVAGTSFIMPDLYLIRDAANYTISVADSNGKKIFEHNLGTVSSFVSGGNDPYLGLLGSFNSDGLKNLFAELDEGEYTYTVTASSISSDGSAAAPQSLSYHFTVDNTAPTNTSDRVYTKNDRVYLELKAKDKNGIQGFLLYTANESNGKYTYSDRLSDLISDGYISADAYKLVKVQSDETSAIYTYDITELQHQLSRLGIYSSEAVSERPSSYKIFYRAADYAYNLSKPALCGTIPLGAVTYKITDTDGIPVSGVTMSLGDLTAQSSADGTVRFENVIPDMYGARITDLPEGCKTDFYADIVRIHIGRLYYSGKIIIERTKEAQLAETAVENEESEISGVKTVKSDHEAVNSKTPTEVDSVFALIFVAVLLIISAASFILSRYKKEIKIDLK